MIITTTTTQQVEETFEVETPSAYYNEFCNRHSLLKENGDIIVFSPTHIIKWTVERSAKYHAEAVAEALKGNKVNYDEASTELEIILESFSEKIEL